VHIKKFQNLMRQLYFERDSERGIKGTIDWLEDEFKELKEAIHKGDINAVKEEFADVLAWLASLANILDLDLENAAISKYPSKCPKCGKKPCECQF